VLKCAERTELLRLPVKRESWLGGGDGGAAGAGGRDEDCSPEIVSLSEQRPQTNPAWPWAP